MFQKCKKLDKVVVSELTKGLVLVNRKDLNVGEFHLLRQLGGKPISHMQGTAYKRHKKRNNREREIRCICCRTPSCYALMYLLSFISPVWGPTLENWVSSSSHQCSAKCPRLTDGILGKQGFSLSGCQNKSWQTQQATGQSWQSKAAVCLQTYERVKFPKRQQSRV